MSRRCELTGKGVQVGHKVSHSNVKTKRRFLPNLSSVTLLSDVLGRSVRLRITAHALRSVEHRGGLDAFLVKAGEDELSLKARELKRQVEKAGMGTSLLPGFGEVPLWVTLGLGDFALKVVCALALLAPYGVLIAREPHRQAP